MKKVLLVALFLLLNGCSYESFLALGEVDKVEVVKKNASISHYRAYFTRTQLKPIKNKQKYLYFYSKKDKDLGILLYKNNTYTLYPIYHPAKSTLRFHTQRYAHYRDVKKALRKKGYRLTSLQAIGATSKVALRKYKGIKTLLVEIKDYRKLQRRYKKAIRSYDASSVLKTRTALPHTLIAHYFNTYQKSASSKRQKKQLKIIANKLHLSTPDIKEKEKETVHKVQEALALEVPEENKKPVDIKPSVPFDYYAHEASYHELDTYLSKDGIKDSLSFTQYTTLTQKHTQLKEQELLKDGSLEALIEAYKTNKKPQYKQRILELMKEAQK